MFLLWALLAQSGECPVLLEHGRKAYEAREFDRATAEFERALPVCPNRGQVLLALGQAQFLAQRIDASITTLRQLAALEPRSVGWLFVRRVIKTSSATPSL